MAIIIDLIDIRISVSVENPSATLHYLVANAPSEVDCRLVVEQTIPNTYNIGSALGLTEAAFQNYDVVHLGNGIWDVEVKYARNTPRTATSGSGGVPGSGGGGGGGGGGGPGNGGATSGAGGWRINFETGGGTQHIAKSLGTTSYGGFDEFFDPITPPDFSNAINVNNDTVSGVDIGLAVYRWSETWIVPRYVMTSAYRKIVADLTFTVNHAAFREFPGFEVLFEGASGSDRGSNDYEMTYKFARQKYSTHTIGDMTGIAKEGWEYLWIRWMDSVDPNSHSPIKVPESVYVEKVYEYSDFGQLGIGTLPLD